MAQLSRKLTRIFCGDVGYTGNIAQFGSKGASAPAYSNDVETIQGLTGWSNGWADAVTNNNCPPLQDMNSFFYVMTKQLAYIEENGIPAWDDGTTYYIGSIVSDDLGTVYMSAIDDNTNQALTDASKWINLVSRNVTTHNADTDYTAVNSDWYIRVIYTITAAKYVILPTPSAGNKGRKIIVKMKGATAISQLGIKSANASTIDGASAIWLSENGVKVLVSNGTNWETI